jgi:predicted nucleotidyltransferase
MNSLLTQTKQAFADVKSSVVVAMQKLYEVQQSEVYLEVADSWNEYVQSELGISQGFASKLLTVNRHYLIEGGMAPEDIAGVDYEKLYLARDLEVPMLEKLESARHLTRRELREASSEQVHEHSGETTLIHRCCGMRCE